MDTSARDPSAAAAAMRGCQHPRDETATDKNETDPFAGSDEDVSSEEYAENPGKAMAAHMISEEEKEEGDNSEEGSGNMSVDGDAASKHAAASTPTRPSKENFRIVTIEYPVGNNSGTKPTSDQHTYTAEHDSGDEHHAATTIAAPQTVSGDNSKGNSAAGKKGDENSANSIPQMSDAKILCDAGSAKSNAAKKGDGKKVLKFPACARRRRIITPPPPT
jgi:hypothetical protein